MLKLFFSEKIISSRFSDMKKVVSTTKQGGREHLLEIYKLTGG